MKATIRIPTVQFGYIEFELEDVKHEDLSKVIDVHNQLVGLYEVKKSEVQKLKDDNF